MNNNEKGTNILRILFHLIVLIAGFVLGFLFIGKGVRFDSLLGKKEAAVEEQDPVETEVTSEYFEPQLIQDLKDKVVSMDEFFKNMLFAEYDQEYLSQRYYQLKKSEFAMDTDFIAYTYEEKITDTTMKYYLDRVLLSGVTFDLDKENEKTEKESIVAYVQADEVRAGDYNKKVNLNRAVLSGNGNFVVWYTTTGDSAISESDAMRIANSLEYARYDYDSLYSRYYKFKADFYNTGNVVNSQLAVYNKEGIDSKYLKEAMQVYVVDYTDNASSKYIIAGDHLVSIYNRFREGNADGSIPGPYLIIKASDYVKDKERTMQIANRELFRFYQYNIYCPDESCLINGDPYYFDATASYASAVTTRKTTYSGFLNEVSSFARAHAADLLADETIAKYGEKNIGNALFLYLYYYAKIVPDGNKKIVEAIYKESPFEFLEAKAGDKYAAQILQELALEHLKQNSMNKNLISSPDVEDKLVAQGSFDSTSNVSNRVLERLGLEFYVLNKRDHDYRIELGRSNTNIICMLVGVYNETYTLLAQASVSSINVLFDTANYRIMQEPNRTYDTFYIIVGNSSILNKNVFSLDVVEY